MTNTKKGLAIVTNAGGVGVIAIDDIENTNIILAKLSKKTQSDLKSTLPAASSTLNPIDILGDGDSVRYKKTLEILIKDENINSILVILTPQVMTDVENIANIVVEFAQKYTNIVIIPVFIGGGKVSSSYQIFSQNNIVFYQTPEDAIVGLSYLFEYSKNKQKLEFAENNPNPIKEISLDKKHLENIQIQIDKNLKRQNKALDFDTVNLIADLFCIPMPKFIRTFSASDNDIKLFLDKNQSGSVLKSVSANLLHRSDSGMVRLGVKLLNEVKEFQKMHPEEDIILQELAPKGVEVFVGIKKDPQFGLVLVIGTGGIYAEIYHDFALTPMVENRQAILEKLSETKVYKILTGYRNKFFDIDSLVEVVHNLCVLVNTLPDILSLDMNPYIALSKGGAAVDLKILI